MNNYAVINSQTKIVENIISWDGVSPWSPPDGCFVEQFTSLAGVGYTWNGSTFDPPVNSGPTAEENKATAIQLLADTDWVNQPDVINPANNPHLLNKTAFDAYRVAVRQYAVYPVAGNINWPAKPQEQWSQ